MQNIDEIENLNKHISKIPGIGPKTARRIIVELKDKFVKLDKDDLPFENENTLTKSFSEAIQALETLGYKTSIINKTIAELKIRDEKNINTQEIIKRVLGKLRWKKQFYMISIIT